MATFLQRVAHRVRSADTNDAAVRVLDDLMGAGGGEPKMDDNGDQHIHLHLDKGGGGAVQDDDPPIDVGVGGEPDTGQLAAAVSELLQRVEQLEAQVGGNGNGGGNGGENDDGEEVELTDPETKDARRYTMRRGRSLKMRDEEPPVPDRLENSEMLGETDLPGVEDLPQSTGDRMRRFRSGDSADMEPNWVDTIALAEVITPGIRVPTFDARLTPERTAVRLCAFRRQTLDRALKDEYTANVMNDLVGIRTADQVKTLGCDTVKMAFNATGNALKSRVNNQQYTRSVGTGDAKSRDNQAFTGPITIAEIQRRNRIAWETGEFKKPV
jgi:hypothetical protein